MDNLISETNARLQEIIDNLNTIKSEYENKVQVNAEEIEKELATVKEYKEEFFTSKTKIDKMNSDIEGFEKDYQSLVDRFKDDELANILIAANKEISLKIDERKRKIISDKNAMNELVEKAEKVKKRLVKLTAEKKALEICLNRILDAHDYYTTSLLDIIDYTEKNHGNLSSKKIDVTNEDDIQLDSEDYNIEEMKKAYENEIENDTMLQENDVPNVEIKDEDQIVTDTTSTDDENQVFTPLMFDDNNNNSSDIGNIGELKFNSTDSAEIQEKNDDSDDVQIDDSIFNIEFDDEIKDE